MCEFTNSKILAVKTRCSSSHNYDLLWQLRRGTTLCQKHVDRPQRCRLMRLFLITCRSERQSFNSAAFTTSWRHYKILLPLLLVRTHKTSKHNVIAFSPHSQTNTPCRRLGQLIGISLSANEPTSKALGLCWLLFILCCIRNWKPPTQL